VIPYWGKHSLLLLTVRKREGNIKFIFIDKAMFMRLLNEDYDMIQIHHPCAKSK
jgi:hypothetical protein